MRRALRATKSSMRTLLISATPRVLQPVPVRLTAKPFNALGDVHYQNSWSAGLAASQSERSAGGAASLLHCAIMSANTYVRFGSGNIWPCSVVSCGKAQSVTGPK